MAPPGKGPSAASPIRLWALRSGLVVVGLGLWFWTQSLIGARPFPAEGLGDRVHELTASWHRYFLTHQAATDALLIVSSALIDLTGVFLLASSIFGPTVRPFLGLLVLFALRQACQGLCALPAPEAMIWHHPGFPSLLVTYGVSNDLFFSGHTAIAVYGATALARLGGPRLWTLGAAVAAFEAGTVLVLRAHYTMDVFTGVVAACLVAMVVDGLASPCDRMLAALSARFTVRAAPAGEACDAPRPLDDPAESKGLSDGAPRGR